MMDGMLLFMVLPAPLATIGVALLLAWAQRQSTGRGRTTHRDDPALATLRRRYADGELSREQYRQMAEVLGAEATWPEAHGAGLPR